MKLKKCMMALKLATGLAIFQDFSIISASADGRAADFVLEIKCPINHKTVTNYIKNDIVQPKVLSQNPNACL